jgi:hypothetical protein
MAQKKTIIVTKSFRLLDFHTFDKNPEKLSDSDSDSNNGKPYSNTDELQFIIQMFGLNEKGETCSIFIQDFQPFFYIKVGNGWTDTTVNMLKFHILSKIDKRFYNSILSVELVECQSLYGFTGGKNDKFALFKFKNTMVMNRVKNLWYKYEEDANQPSTKKRIKVKFLFQGCALDLYESNIPSILRYFHIQNISPSGWVSVQTSRCLKPFIKTTTCTYEYICNIHNLKPLPEKETRVPYKICSFDIEASSSHGDFPLPIKTYKRLATNIIDIFIKQFDFLDANKSKILLQKVILTAFNYDRFDDVDIVYPKIMPSKETLIQFIQLIVNESMEKVKKTNLNEDSSMLFTIDSIFDQIKEMENQLDKDKDNNNDNDNEVAEEVHYSKKGNNKSKSKSKKVERATTIIDILLNTHYDRDEKIQIVNDVITRVFPRLEGDKVTFIGSTFMNYGEQETYKKIGRAHV